MSDVSFCNPILNGDSTATRRGGDSPSAGTPAATRGSGDDDRDEFKEFGGTNPDMDPGIVNNEDDANTKINSIHPTNTVKRKRNRKQKRTNKRWQTSEPQLATALFMSTEEECAEQQSITLMKKALEMSMVETQPVPATSTTGDSIKPPGVADALMHDEEEDEYDNMQMALQMSMQANEEFQDSRFVNQLPESLPELNLLEPTLWMH